MGIDVGQAVAGGEVFEPAGDAVRVHVIAVVLGKDIAGILSLLDRLSDKQIEYVYHLLKRLFEA